MKPSFVDTNIFIEALIRQGAKSKNCLRLLENPNNSLCTSLLVIVEIEWVLRSFYNLPKAEIITVFKRITSLRNLEVKNRRQILDALAIYEKISADFVDCLTAVQSSSAKIAEVISYDVDFDKFPGLKRVEP